MFEDVADGDGFFALDRAAFIDACALGLNPAAALLVLARGTGADNARTRWSAEAVKQRLGIRWRSAKTAIGHLANAGIVTVDGPPTRPKHTLRKEDSLIWLPNALVDGVDAELPPITKLVQHQDVMTLRLFVELYHVQNLREDGGISPTVIYRLHPRAKVGQRGPYVVWQFGDPKEYVRFGNPVTDPHRIALSKKEEGEGKSSSADFFTRLGWIRYMGLIEWVPHLFTGPKGEPIQPLWREGDEWEADLFFACNEAAQRCLTLPQVEQFGCEATGYPLVPAPAHMTEVQLIGIARLTYRPHTKLTAAWLAEHADTCWRGEQAYDAIYPASTVSPAASNTV